jgi:hypothetical protein
VNDNRNPAEHRATTTEQSAVQPRGNPRPYRSSRWPQAERLQADAGGPQMVAAMVDWRSFNAMPVMCVANDNYEGEERNTEAGDSVREQPNHDLRMDTITGDRVVALHAKGKSWRPDEERFDRPRQNNPERAPAAGIFTLNGATYYQAEADAEDEANRAIDCTSARRRLGHVCCRLLDLASGDSTTEEIAAAVKQPGNERAPVWIDWAIVRWVRDDAYQDYAMTG